MPAVRKPINYSPHTLVAFGGGLGLDVPSPAGYPEIWQCTVRVVAGLGLGPIADPVTYMNDIAGPLGVWFGNDSQCATSAALQWLKVNNIGADGKYTDKTHTHVHDYAPAITGYVVPAVPNILSVATSWRTAINRGPGKNGRIYLPNYVFPTSGGMTLTIGQQNGVAAAGLALLQLLAHSGEASPVVASSVNATNTYVNRVAVGDVLDVQRRRKDAYKESYVEVPFP